MVAFAKSFAPEISVAEPKTRVWDFFGDCLDRVGETEPQVVDGVWVILVVEVRPRRSPSLARSNQAKIDRLGESDSYSLIYGGGVWVCKLRIVEGIDVSRSGS